MPVQNFLEDEDYDPQDSGSAVPDFLQDEVYEDEGDGEYYGGGFLDGAGASAVADGFGGTSAESYGSSNQDFDPADREEFDGYEDDEDELFDGEAFFGLNGSGTVEASSRPTNSDTTTDGDTPRGSQEDEHSPDSSSSYGIRGVTPRTASSSTGIATTSRKDGSTVAEPTSTTEATRVEEASTTPKGSVPDFLSDEEDDFEAPPLRQSTPVADATPSSSPNGAIGSTNTSGSSSSNGSESSSSSSNGSTEAPRGRRDLSKRPGRPVSYNPSAPVAVPARTDDSIGADSRSAPSGGSAPTSNDPSSSPRTPPPIPFRAPRGASLSDTGSKGSAQEESQRTPESATSQPAVRPVETVRFDSKAGSAPLSEEEAAELKAPSDYAAKRDLKFTALKQKDSTVRRVGADGLTPAERKRAARTSAGAAIRTPANGRLSQDELLFYANLGAQRAGDFGGSAKKQLFLPPVLQESADQKREREARINRALANGSIAHGAKSRLTEKDYRVLQFMALFKFVSERQIGKLLQCAEITAYKRLNELRKHGLTKGFKTLGVKGSVWVLTETGMDLSGFELPRGTESALTLSMVSHQFTVNHVAAHLWSGGSNVLREKSFPQRNLPDGRGGFDFGERIISELQIQSAFGKIRGSARADAFVPEVKRHLAGQFDDWQRAGGPKFGDSPELQRGNEYMWTLFPPVSNRLNYHVPDLVVARPRSSDGKPQSIAVEIELRTKADDSSYERTLDAYRVDDSIYRKVVWVCRLKGTAEKLARIAKRNGLAEQGRIEIVPIYLQDGSRFTGKDTWSL